MLCAHFRDYNLPRNYIINGVVQFVLIIIEPGASHDDLKEKTSDGMASWKITGKSRSRFSKEY